MSLASYVFRRMCEKSDTKRDRGLTVPDGVTLIESLPYGPDRKYNTLDICFPSDRNSAATIINVHGGGYVYGSTKPYKFYCCDLASKGYTVISFNYRLAPKHKFPAPLEDLNLVAEWMCSHVNEYPIDTKNVFMVGDSAGAQLTSQYAAIWSNPEYSGIMGITPPGFRLAAVGLNCGMYDMIEHTSQKNMQNPMVRDYFTCNPAQFGEKLNVLEYITAAYPPAYLLSAPGDFLVSHMQPMAELLRSKGVACECGLYGDETTGHVFHINIRTELAQQANSDELNFMSAYIVQE